jgi:hypothetical protein
MLANEVNDAPAVIALLEVLNVNAATSDRRSPMARARRPHSAHVGRI